MKRVRNPLKVAKWEIKRNLKNKSFLIGLFLTPVLMFGFGLIGVLMGDSDDADSETVDVYVHDDIGVFDAFEETADERDFDWHLEETDVSEDAARAELDDTENTAYIFVDEEALDEGTIPVYTSEDMPTFFMGDAQVMEGPVKAKQLDELGFSDEELTMVSTPIEFADAVGVDGGGAVEDDKTMADTLGMDEEEIKKRVVSGGFAVIILLSIIFSGMYIFQSASQEKKDKIAEIILSSVTPGELMQGKIIGYFVLGMIQALVLLLFAVPFAMWQMDLNVFQYLFVPETALLVALAIMGYLLFAAIFVGIGATMADVSSAGQFQGMVLMLPFLPFIFIGPVMSDPSGMIAQIGTYIPFTSPGILILRLSMLQEWPWTEIIISLAILAVSIWIFMKLAGKIFKVGILMYGKNATPREILKWIRA